ncbi:hypothetical protein D3C86_1984450 [compost metagenome]
MLDTEKNTPPRNMSGKETRPEIGPALSGVLATPAMMKPIDINVKVPMTINKRSNHHEPLT